jgi:hypothetical protein
VTYSSPSHLHHPPSPLQSHHFPIFYTAKQHHYITNQSLGAIVTCAGIVGTINNFLFKAFWVKNFTDITLITGGVITILIALLLIINWGPGTGTSVGLYIFSLYVVYSFGYPVGNSAVLGSFSTVQKAGKMATAQSQFAMAGR